MDILHISRSMVAKLVATGQLTAVRVGRNQRFTPGDVLAYIERKRGIGAGSNFTPHLGNIHRSST